MSPQSACALLTKRISGHKVWILAAIIALTGHVAFAAFAVTRMLDDADDEDLGAPGIEVSVELASPRLKPSDLPPGPESDASAASRAAVQQKTEVNPDHEQDKPNVTDQADRQVSASKTKDLNKNRPETQKSNASEDSAAQQATAAPSATAVAPVSTTVEQGIGQSRYRARMSWQRELIAHLNRYKHYPDDRSAQSAEILIKMTLDRIGKVVDVGIAKSSGDTAFDSAALTMVQKASPVPAPPPLVADEGLTFSLPVIFEKNAHN
jgi:periplasmic protein TonB